MAKGGISVATPRELCGRGRYGSLHIAAHLRCTQSYERYRVGHTRCTQSYKRESRSHASHTIVRKREGNRELKREKQETGKDRQRSAINTRQQRSRAERALSADKKQWFPCDTTILQQVATRPQPNHKFLYGAQV